jgi:hypothetical protein
LGLKLRQRVFIGELVKPLQQSVENTTAAVDNRCAAAVAQKTGSR